MKIGIVNVDFDSIETYKKWLKNFGFTDVISIGSDAAISMYEPDLLIFKDGPEIGKKAILDKKERECYNKARKNNIPILGIGRGMLYIAYLNGAQIADIKEEYIKEHKKPHDKTIWHKITLSDGREFDVISNHSKQVFYLPFLYHTVGFDVHGIPEYAEENDILLVQCRADNNDMWDTPFEKLVIDFISKFEKN